MLICVNVSCAVIQLMMYLLPSFYLSSLQNEKMIDSCFDMCRLWNPPTQGQYEIWIVLFLKILLSSC